jgi:cardiolipin synthase
MKSDDLKILVDGERTYREILEAILSAREYVLFQFYIFKPDEAGTKFVEALKAKAKEGVRIYFLADKVGSSLGSKFMRELRDAGIEVAQFTSSKNWETKFQINFRNHRKVVVVDGRVAFVGGHNIGNEYLGKSSLGYWRDTHLRLSGECVSAAQVSFVKDWYWSAESLPKLNWKIDEGQEEGSTIVVSTGPADRGNLCLLSLLHLINGAKKRIWITTPYFVPPEAMSHALALAVLRGVDVRIILTKVTDNLILDRASTVYIEALLRAGIKFYRFRPGFMHQKVLLIDESGAIGSVNLDNRSIFINFEIMAISTEVKFVRELHEMLQNDLDLSEPVSLEEFAKKPVLRRLLARVVNLFAPVL